jgi:nucleoside-triphosphatase THEP1
VTTATYNIVHVRVFELVKHAYAITAHPVVAHKQVVTAEFHSVGIELVQNAFSAADVIVVGGLSTADMKFAKVLALFVECATPLVHVVAYVQLPGVYVEIQSLSGIHTVTMHFSVGT